MTYLLREVQWWTQMWTPNFNGLQILSSNDLHTIQTIIKYKLPSNQLSDHFSLEPMQFDEVSNRFDYIELNTCKTKIWHKKGSRPAVIKTKHPRKRMFWGGIAFDRTTPLFQVLRSITSDSYFQFFDDMILPFLRRKRMESFIVQQNNAPAHPRARPMP